ncbi:MAG: hypothetical protein BWY15_00613 [Firmicutes bacterium ADurb.Bin193]|nr:MAG: hypothetical protein BWY15_00613 [Firmicutes bacterium ADurb.Bin193]
MGMLMKKALRLTGLHITGIAITFFFMIALGWVIRKWGFVAFSVVTAVFYCSLFYSEGWNWGRSEGKSFSQVKPSLLRVVKSSSVLVGVCLIFACIAAVRLLNNPLFDFIIRIWYMPFLGFYKKTEDISVAEIILSGMAAPLTVMIAYLMGWKNFSVLDRLAALKKQMNEQKSSKE